MRNLTNAFTLLTGLSILLSGCSTAGGDKTENNESGVPACCQEKKSALPVVNPAYPGPFKTYMVEGAERLQGRYPAGVQGGSLVRVIVGLDPKTFNPWTAADSLSSELGGTMFRGLAQTDMFNGDVVPDLAVEIKELPDHVTYITRLRKGLKWSDGKPITSADVEFTWNKIIGQGYGNTSIRDIAQVEGKMPKVTSEDELTNKFVTAKPFVPFKRLLATPIAPKHIVEPIISKKDGHRQFEQLWSVNCNPASLITSGPYVLSRFVPSQRVELKKTSNFYMLDQKGRGLPNIDKQIYTIIPDVNTLLLKFKAKEIDITQLRARDVVDLLKNQKAGNYRLYNLGPSTGSFFLVFNMNQRNDGKSKKPYVDPIKSAWFNDTNFRQAVNHIIDRQKIVANYFKGIGSVSHTSMPEASPFYDKDLPAFSPDLKAAEDMLRQSGFVKKPDGYLYDKKGHKVEFDLLYASGGTFYPAAAGMIADDMKKLGIKANLQELNFNVIQDKMDSKKDWDAQLMALTGDPLEPHNGANVFRTDGRLHLFDQRDHDDKGNIKVTDARPWEKRMDEIYDLAACEFDQTKRKALYDEFQKIIYDQAPFIYIVCPTSIIGTRNTIKNYDPTPLSQTIMGLHNLEEIYKEQGSAQ
ncbi:MAG: ABC transporter substrate-binding protein [Candidatus Obscuribacterales bacterium]|nr:ABC transporter substrate-binding protein [Candidatus Obscuribacterales bacterium]